MFGSSLIKQVASFFYLAMVVTCTSAQINYNGAAYSQDFQSLSGSTPTAVTSTSLSMNEVCGQSNGGAVCGWYFYGLGTTTRWGLTEGTTSTGGFYSLTDAGYTSRAFGSQGSSSNNGYFGMVLKNTSGCAISSFTLTYNPVICRNPASTINNFPVSYLISATPIATSGSGAGTFNDAAGAWNSTSLGFSTPSSGTGAPGVQAAINPMFVSATSGGTISGINWLPNTYLYIRWKEQDETGADATAGIDNVSFSTSTCSGPTSSVLTGTTTICSGSSASLSVAINGSAGPYTVTLTDGTNLITTPNYVSGTSIMVSPASTTTYSIQCVSTNGGCIGNGNTGTATVTVNPTLTPTIMLSASPNGSVCVGTVVTYTANTTNVGSSPIYNFSINNVIVQSGTSNVFATNTLSNGVVVKCDVIPSYSCLNPSTVSASQIVSILPSPTAIINSTSNNVCYGSSLTLTASGGAGYTWAPGTIPGSILSVTPLMNVTFTVTATDAQGCTGTSTIAIQVNPLPTITATSSSSSCYSGFSVISCNGNLGTSPYTYSLNGGAFQSSSSLNAQVSGVYTVTVKDSKQCTATATVTVVQPPQIQITNVFNPIACNGLTTNLSINALGGNGNYTYSLNGGSFQNSNQFAGLSSGLYTVAVMDGNSCSNSTTLQITQPNLFTATASTGQINCYGGFTTVSVSGFGGTLPYSGSGNFPIAAGPYFITITDANGCTATVSGSVSQPTMLSASSSVVSTPLCYGGNGVIQLSGTGGTAPYSGIGNVMVPGGNYSVIISDANGCTASVSGLLPQPSPVVAVVNSSTILCNGGVSLISVTGSGGTAPYVQSNFVLPAGIYQFSTTDANGCNSPALNVSISEPPFLTCTATLVTPISCNGGLAGVSVVGNGGTPFTTIPYYSGAGIQQAPAGGATFTITDANGCTASTSISIPQPSPITITATASNNTVCSNTTTTLNVTGGSISYVWQPGGLVGTQQIVAPLVSTVYTVTGTDGSGCTVTSAIPVSVTAGSISLALTTGSNSSSSGFQSFSQLHPDGSSLTYYGANCKPMLRIQDAVGGNTLGITQCNTTVLASVPFYNAQPYLARYFQITPTNNGSATVTLFVTQDDFDDYNAANGSWPDLPQSGSNSDPLISTIRITKVDGTLGSGIPTVITPTVFWNGNYWELTFPVNSFSSFYIHSANPGNAALPVSLEYFKGVVNNGQYELSWKTGSELHNDFFILERSENGMEFEDLAHISSKALNGNSSQPLFYNYTDFPSNPPAHIYYRLSQQDLDGRKYVTSQVIDLFHSEIGYIFSVYPNPVSSLLNVDVHGIQKKEALHVEVISSIGNRVKKESISDPTSMHSLSMNVSDLPAGVYMLRISNSKETIYHTRFVKE